jgi:hypothetical protein
MLTGCSSDISTVKSQKFSYDPSLTIGQAFDNRKICQSVDWKELKDDRGRNVVEYRCTFKGVDEWMKKVVSIRKSESEEIANEGKADCQKITDQKSNEECLKKVDEVLQKNLSASIPSNPATKFQEVFQWSVSDNKEVTLLYAGQEWLYKDGKTIQNKIYDLDTFMRKIAQNDESTLLEYAGIPSNVTDVLSVN